MIIKNTFKAIIISLAFLFSYSAGAIPFIPPSTDTDYNYIGLRGGKVFPGNTRGNSNLQSVSPDSSYIAGAYIGRKFKERFALEIEYMNREESDINSSASTFNETMSNSWKVSSNSLMLNLVADLMTKEIAIPYLKLGLGVSRNHAGTYSFNNITSDDNITQTWNSRSLTEFTWQAAIGVNISITNSIDANIEYAFIDRGQFKTKNESRYLGGDDDFIDRSTSPKIGKLREQALTLGFRLKF
jgi:opacity protein-like surface antigen